MQVVFTISEGPYKGRQIRVSRYAKTAAGVSIQVDHNVKPLPGKQLQWIQTVSSNGGFSKLCNLKTRVDPFGVGGPVNTVSLPAVPGVCKADDLLPFYWTAADLANGAGPGLSDSPQVPAPATGLVWTQFVTALTEVTGANVHTLIAISWGYERRADGSVHIYGIRKPTAAEMAEYFKALRFMYPSYRYG
jgi:hypothetical protein